CSCLQTCALPGGALAGRPDLSAPKRGPIALFPAPARHRVEGGRCDCLAGTQAEAGMVPGASHGVADNQSVGERAAVMRTSRADREQFVAMAREQHGVVAHMPAHHAAIGNVTNGHAAGEIRPFWLGLLSAHGTSYDRR